MFKSPIYKLQSLVQFKVIQFFFFEEFPLQKKKWTISWAIRHCSLGDYAGKRCIDSRRTVRDKNGKSIHEDVDCLNKRLNTKCHLTRWLMAKFRPDPPPMNRKIAFCLLYNRLNIPKWKSQSSIIIVERRFSFVLLLLLFLLELLLRPTATFLFSNNSTI